MSMRSRPILLAASLALGGSALARAGSAPVESGATASPTPTTSPVGRIVVILMENHEYSSVIGSSDAPYFNKLAHKIVLLTKEYAVAHPSLPNYLALTGGSTFGMTSDCTTCDVKARNLVDQLEAHGFSWKAYMESMPGPCFTGSVAGTSPGDYAKKHDPFMYYDDIRSRPKRCKKIVPLGRLSKDLKNGLPQFAWITPNECYDMHSCSVATGDAWLKAWVPRILPALGPTGIMMVIFDEGSSDAACCSLDTGGGHVAAIITGPGARHGRKIRTAVDHYSLLRLIEDEWGFKRLGHAADSTTRSITGWRA
jgi:hypothetical protein